MFDLYKRHFKDSFKEEYEVNNLKINIQRQENALKAMNDKDSLRYKERQAYIKQLKAKLKDVEADNKKINKRDRTKPY